MFMINPRFEAAWPASEISSIEEVTLGKDYPVPQRKERGECTEKM
jgi:hypothetical protein